MSEFPCGRMEYLLLSQPQKYPLPQQTSLPPSTASSSSRNISPALLFIIVILAAIFFLSGLLHLLIRFLIKKSASRSRSSRGGTQDFPGSVDALQRQLQQLFYLHDSGLDQASIDALPVFTYSEIVGGGGSCSKDPFDCAVCLCEFLREDRLRLLPLCGHAFHLCCIDTWLLSNSTCPLCRGALLVQGAAVENPVFGSDGEVSRLEEGALGREVEVPVRLGKFRSTGNGNEQGNSIDESSSSNLDTRRCYSMGSYQYIVGDANLRVALSVGDRSGRRGRGKESSGNLDVTVGFEEEEEEEEEGKRLGAARKGESFSVSKIWLWRNKKGKLPDSSVSSGDSM